MRHELQLGDWIITSDNSAAIGEKPNDTVFAPDKITAKFAARVALLEQWAAGSEPEAVLLHNFSGEAQWEPYLSGIAELFAELGRPLPPHSGSSETNMATMQSGVAVTLIGKQTREMDPPDGLAWFVYGKPLMGKEILEQSESIADLKKIADALSIGWVHRIWPVGSKGIAREAELLFGRKLRCSTGVNTEASAGPASCVLLGVSTKEKKLLERHFGSSLYPLTIE